MKEQSFTVRPLAPDLLPDFMDLFDHRAFSDNPQWAHCYCVFFHHPGTVGEWMAETGESNRRRAAGLIESGLLKGFLAYRGGIPVGWCNANRKRSFCFNKERVEAPGDGDDETLSVVCFVIAPGFRRMGASRALLDAVIDHYRGSGLRRIEAYPSREGPSGEGGRDADHYHGPLSLYLKRGFRIVRELERYLVVELPLRGA
ncbi:MAG: GNAT family N-acetyltransferase [Spirochaetes bacterium]|nr:GNAT family N-acetyltransferase [Spirochaetota bacterium]